MPGSKIKTFGPKSGGGTAGASAGGQPMIAREPESAPPPSGVTDEASGSAVDEVRSIEASLVSRPPSSDAAPAVPALPPVLDPPPDPAMAEEPAVPEEV